MNPNNPKRKQDGSILQYKIRDVVITHCYDLPHLLKVVRNNLMTKNLKHCISRRWSIFNKDTCKADSKTYIASWVDVSDVYDFDLKGTQRLLENITDEHIAPNRQKMKVDNATQVFSQTFGNVMLHFSGKKDFERDCFGTAQVLLFFNDLFDSLNGSDESEGECLNGSIDANSVHFVYWEYALQMLSKMYFVDKETGLPNNRSSVIFKFMSTIRGFIEISSICLNLMKEVSLRYNFSPNIFCASKY